MAPVHDNPSSKAEFYLLELRKVPLATWTATSPIGDWLRYCETAGKDGFAPGKLLTLPPCSFWVQLERCLYFPLEITSTRILPFAMPLLIALRFCTKASLVKKVKHVCTLLGLQALLWHANVRWWRQLIRWAWAPQSRSRLTRSISGEDMDTAALLKYHLDTNGFWERPNLEYFGTKWVIPRSIVEDHGTLPASIVCLTPHGFQPFGWSGAMYRLLAHFVRIGAAPVFFKVPFIRGWLKRLGVYPAGKAGITKCLAAGENAGLALDGILGMFYGGKSNGDEELYLKARKPVCAIALQTGSPIIPGYCFGTNDVCTIFDPCLGVLTWLSKRLDISLTPWLGRWWLPFGPPARRPLAMCIGDPIPCAKLPWDQMSEASRRAAVDDKHKELLEAYRTIFDKHKAAYGRPHAKLTFV